MPARSRQVVPSAPAHFTMFSRGRVYGIFESLEVVQRCMAGLVEQGLGDQAVQVLIGEDGERALDVSGHHHGMWARLLRLMQGVTDERPHIEQYVHALGHGSIVLSVNMSGSACTVAQVAAVFQESGARFVNFYGPWVVESLSA